VRYVGRRGHLEEFFQQFRDLSYTPQDPEGGPALWGISMIGPGPQQPEEGMMTESPAIEEPELPL
jgi:hypothetical protein